VILDLQKSLGNAHLNLPTIRKLVNKRERTILGGNIQVTILRSKSHMKSLSLIIDQFSTLNDLRKRVFELVREENQTQ
jgi:hypothetical protein